MEDGTAVEVGAAAHVGDGAWCVASAPQLVVCCVEGISHSHVEREELVALEVVANVR